VHVRIASGDDEAEADLALSDEERIRLQTFGSADRRRSFALGRLAARSLLSEALGAPAPLAPLGLAPAGWPEVLGHELYLSIAHAGRGAGVAAAAALAGRPVGVDLETAGPRHPGLLDRLLGPEEAALPGALAATAADAPALVWALKESVLKGLGTGLRRGARSVIVDARGEGIAMAHDGDTEWTIRYERAGPFWLAVAWRELGDE
jgi:4'-phosphopantetheinyl transferase